MDLLVPSKIWHCNCFHGSNQKKILKFFLFFFLKNFFNYRLVSKLLLPHERNLYLVATSGDTGGAVIDGFSRLSEEQK